MKRSILIMIQWCVVAGISAQITVTNSTFPVAGDTLKLAFDYTPEGIFALTPPGGNQHWDFTSLQVDAAQDIVFNPADQGIVGGQVPGAELYTVLSPNTESYYNVTPTNFDLEAYYGIVPYDLVANNLFNYRPSFPQRYAPLNFFDIRASSSGFLENFVPSDFSPLLMINLAALTNNANIDSMRYRLAISQICAVDGWGSVSIPGGTYDVLREKRTLYRETRIDAKIGPLGWLDITDLTIQAGFYGLGVDTLVSFHFYNDVVKEPIAIVTVNNAQNASTYVQFKNTAQVSAVEEAVGIYPSISVSPNPAHDEAFIHFNSITSGAYKLVVFDELGRMVQQNSLLTDGQHQEQINLSGLLPGMYVLTVFDEHDRILCREKLIKVRD